MNVHQIRQWHITFSVSTPFFLPLSKECAKPLSNDSFLAAERTYQPAAKIMERPQLILSIALTEPYQMRERRAYACYAQAKFYINGVLRHKEKANKMICSYRVIIA